MPSNLKFGLKFFNKSLESQAKLVDLKFNDWFWFKTFATKSGEDVGRAESGLPNVAAFRIGMTGGAAIPPQTKRRRSGVFFPLNLLKFDKMEPLWEFLEAFEVIQHNHVFSPPDAPWGCRPCLYRFSLIFLSADVFLVLCHQLHSSTPQVQFLEFFSLVEPFCGGFPPCFSQAYFWHCCLAIPQSQHMWWNSAKRVTLNCFAVSQL